MYVRLSKAPDQTVIDYTITILQFSGFLPVPDQASITQFQSTFSLQDQPAHLTIQQHLSLAVVSLFLLEHGIQVGLFADPSEQFAVISALEAHKISHTLFGDNCAVPALSMLA